MKFYALRKRHASGSPLYFDSSRRRWMVGFFLESLEEDPPVIDGDPLLEGSEVVAFELAEAESEVVAEFMAEYAMAGLVSF